MNNLEKDDFASGQGGAELKTGLENCEKDENYYANKEEVIIELEKLIPNHTKIKRFKELAESLLFLYTGSKFINGKGADDIFQLSVKRILMLKRKWYKNKCPEFEKFFIGVIISIIRNERDGKIRAEKKDIGKIVPLYDYENKIENSIYDVEQSKYKENWEYESEEEQQEQKDEDEFISSVLQQFKDDINAYFVLEKRLDGIKSNKEIAENLGIDIKDVENALKRIKRKISFLHKK